MLVRNKRNTVVAQALRAAMMTQQELADLLNVQRMTVNNWNCERGKKTNYQKIAMMIKGLAQCKAELNARESQKTQDVVVNCKDKHNM